MKKTEARHSKKAEDVRAEYYWHRVRRHGRKYEAFHWPSVELILQLFYTYDLVSRYLTQELMKSGLSLSAFNVLTILSRNGGEGLKQHDLSKLLLVSRANITGLMNSLEEQGLVKRCAVPGDRRVCLARITPKGEELLSRILPVHFRKMRKLAGAVGAGDKKTMNRILMQLCSRLTALETGEIP